MDKIADSPEKKGLFGGGGGSVNTRDVQSALLKLLEDAEVPLQTGNGSPNHTSRLPSPKARGPAATPPSVLRTRHVLFVFSGAFTGLEATLRKQQQQQHGGDGGDGGDGGGDGGGGGTDATAQNEHQQQLQPSADDAALPDVLHLAGTSNLVSAGLEPEFVGRIPVRVACRHLTADDLLCVLRDATDSVATQLARDFDGYGITLELKECALREVAERAVRERTGARGLLTVLETTLRDFKFELPGSGVERLEVDVETVRRPAQALEALLAREQSSGA